MLRGEELGAELVRGGAVELGQLGHLDRGVELEEGPDLGQPQLLGSLERLQKGAQQRGTTTGHNNGEQPQAEMFP